MPSSKLSIRIDRDDIGFSAAHFTLFSATERENLHGHNFLAGMEIVAKTEDNGMIFDYRLLKNRLREICGQLDERMLLPTRSEYLRIVRQNTGIHCFFGLEEFVFPIQDVVLLDVPNITLEALSDWFLARMLETPNLPHKLLSEISIFVSSSRGQRANRTLVLT